MLDNRKARRARTARFRCCITKGQAFGRVALLADEVGPLGRDCRIVYRHHGCGVMDRRTTSPLLDDLAEAGVLP